MWHISTLPLFRCHLVEVISPVILGLKFSEKRKAGLQRKSSFNGHWYNRDTSVFTPPKDSYMSVWATSLTKTSEVVKMLMEKYQIQIDTADRFALYVVKDNGGKMIILLRQFHNTQNYFL